MREELKKAKEKLEELEREFRANAKGFLKTEIKSLFDQFPKLNEFSCYVNNHEFNDGEATYFSVGYEDPSLNGVSLRRRAKEENWYGTHAGTDEDLVKDTGLTRAEFKAIGKEINDIFSIVDGQLETLYGEAEGSLTFRRGSNVVEVG